MTAPANQAVATLASLAVPNACACLGPRNQAQIKVKVGVTNLSPGALDISADRFRLSVTTAFASQWAPFHPLGGLSTIRGATLVPPNADTASEPNDGAYTFATHWTQTSLAPGATYLDSSSYHGDLVFYVPLSENGTIAIAGIALLDRSDAVIAYQPFSSFVAQSDPTKF